MLRIEWTGIYTSWNKTLNKWAKPGVSSERAHDGYAISHFQNWGSTILKTFESAKQSYLTQHSI